MNITELPTYIPLKEAAEKYGIPLDTLSQAVNEGLIEAAQIGESIVIADEDAAIIAAQVSNEKIDDELVSIYEAAKRLNIRPGTAYQWYKQGWLPAKGRGSRRAILVSMERARSLCDLKSQKGQQGKRLIPRSKESDSLSKSLS